MSQLPGVCPACEGEGPVGQGCEQKGCANQRLHFVPRPYLEQARASKGRGATEGLGRFIGDYLVVGHIGAGGFGAVLLGLQRPRFLLKAAVKLTRSCLRVAVVGAVVLLVLAVLAICVMTG